MDNDFNAIALDVINNKNLSISEKIDFLVEFKEDTIDEISIIKRKDVHSKRTLLDLEQYRDWLTEQIEILVKSR